MNPKIKADWANALRSGEFTQAKGTLKKLSGGYCCLGVLCELAVREGVISPPVYVDHEYRYAHDLGPDSWSSTSLPFVVQQWAGLDTSDPRAREHLLSIWNDDEGATFPEIADLIEECL